MKKLQVKLLVLLLLVGSIQVSAQIIAIRPEAPHERVRIHSPHVGYIWISAEWNWNSHLRKYEYHPGYWCEPREKEIWISGHWKKHPAGWVWKPGHWTHRH